SEDGLRAATVTGVQTCALPISQDVAPRVAERAARDGLERRQVEPRIDGPRAFAVADPVRQPGHVRADVVAALTNRERPPGACGEIGRAACRGRGASEVT